MPKIQATPSREAGTQYRVRREERRAEADRHQRRSRLISNLRMAAFGLAVVVAWFVWETGSLSPWWMVLPVASFGALVLVHDRVLRRWRRAKSAVDFYERGLARLEHRWAGTGDSGSRFLRRPHPYAGDLDIFGGGSLFELISTARTSWGARTLADWLLSPSSPEDVRARQLAVAELRPKLDLREDVATLDEPLSTEVDPDALSRWAASPPVPLPRWGRYAAALLGIASVTVVVAWLASYTGRQPVLIVLLIEGTFAFWLRDRVRRVITSVEKPARDLGLLSKLLARFESEPFHSARLNELQGSLAVDAMPASLQIARLRRLIELLDARRNKMFAPLAALMLWATHFAYPIESWRARSRAEVGRWLAAIGELEALLSLAAYAYEHPDDPFPEIVDEGPQFEGEGIGHPLIPQERLVRNDLHLGADLRLLVVSGSNMSGKSTLLRTVGTNTVLALAGAPVRATKLRLSPLAVGASIRIQDSLQEGISRFYAEITHLRQIMDMTEADEPLLFLLDEILQGTNSHDRRIGADGVVRNLVDRGAIGLVTTHDLALAEIAESLAPRAANVHFEDHLENGKMTFSYRVQPGVVRKSNALALMRAVGLKV